MTDHLNHPFKPPSFIGTVLWGTLFFVLIGLLAVAWDAARANDGPPPLIAPVKFPAKLAPVAAPSRPKDTAPADGGMCAAPIEDHEPATLLGVLLEQPADEGESTEVAMQMQRCWRGQTKAADPFLVLALYRYEETLGVPPHARGILGAIWCGESAFRTKSSRIDGPIRGDWRDGYSGAWGPFQLHSWAENDPDKCRLVEGGRDDLFASAACWWSRVEARLDSDFVRALKCRDPYPLAEALVANQGVYAALGCKARSTHWAELERWRR